VTALPYGFFPTQVVCIDNDPGLVETLRLNTHQNTATFQLFDNVEIALSYLRDKEKSNMLFERIWQEQGYPLDCSSVGYLYQEIINPLRHETVSCVLIGKKIQDFSGLKVCRKITDPRIKKIYLTPTLEQDTAITAFNQGLIDFYVSKDNPEAPKIIADYINQAQIKYFEELVNSPLQRLLKEWHSLSREGSALEDPLFLDYFKSYLQKNKIKEYYPLDLVGSFICLDAHEKASALLTFTDLSLARHMMDAAELTEAEPHLWKRIKEKLPPPAFCIPSLYHPVFQDPEPFVMPVYPQKFGHQHYNLAFVSQIGNATPSLRDFGILHL
jgi:ActR/RegA family two-component response regulator